MKSEVFRGDLAPLTRDYLWKNWKEHRQSPGKPFYVSLGGSSFLGLNIAYWTGPSMVNREEGISFPLTTNSCSIGKLQTLEVVNPPADTTFETDPAQILKLAQRLASDRSDQIRLDSYGISLEPFELTSGREILTDARIQFVPLGTEATEHVLVDTTTSASPLGIISVLNSYGADDEPEVTLDRAFPVFVEAPIA